MSCVSSNWPLLKIQLRRTVSSLLTATALLTSPGVSSTVAEEFSSYPLQSDETAVTFSSYVSGLVLKERLFMSKTKIVVTDILPSTEASNYASNIKKGFILVSAAGKPIEGSLLETVAEVVSKSPRSDTHTYINIFLHANLN